MPATDQADREPLLPLARMSSDSVVLEVAFVDVPIDDDAWSEQLWQQVDEQHLAPEFRRVMQSNGFRSGLVGIQLPQPLREQLDRFQHASSRLLAEMTSQSTRFRPQNRRIQLREGKRSEIITSGLSDSLVVLVHEGDRVAGETFKEAQTVFELRAFPQGDGSATVHLTPEIQYGPQRPKWIGRDGMFQLETTRKSRHFQDMTIAANLLPGQTLLVTAFDMPSSLGGNFFGCGESGETPKILLVRLAQSQYDDLFDFEQENGSESILATPGPGNRNMAELDAGFEADAGAQAGEEGATGVARSVFESPALSRPARPVGDRLLQLATAVKEKVRRPEPEEDSANRASSSDGLTLDFD